MTDTLVLNADATPVSWMPLKTLVWHKAIKLYFEDRVNIVAEYDDWVVRSPSTRLPVPAVIMLRQYVKQDYRVRFTKYNIKLRDGFVCQYCGNKFDAKDLTIDHVVPQYHGGKSNWTNCVAACGECNRRKAHFLDMLPLAPPRRPTYGDLLERRKAQPLVVHHESWLPFLQWPEDLVIPKWERRRH